MYAFNVSITLNCKSVRKKSVKLAWSLEFGIRFILLRRIARARVRYGVGLGLG